MSLRRSARNVGKANGAATEATESIYKKATAVGATKRTKPPTTTKVEAVSETPSTPLPAKRQRREAADTASPIKPVPFTPTPSGVGLIASSANVTKLKDDHMLDNLASLNQTRPADPLVTNAPVLKPSGDEVIVNESPSKKRKADAPPDVGSPLKKGNSTVDTLLKDAEAHLIEVDKGFMGKGRLERLIKGQQCKMFNPEGLREVVDPFTALASGIIGQQVCFDHCISHTVLGSACGKETYRQPFSFL
jgi:DNA-3-methyladenine glycosylase II